MILVVFGTFEAVRLFVECPLDLVRLSLFDAPLDLLRLSLCDAPSGGFGLFSLAVLACESLSPFVIFQIYQ